jgi:hypothetical protein
MNYAEVKYMTRIVLGAMSLKYTERPICDLKLKEAISVREHIWME